MRAMYGGRKPRAGAADRILNSADELFYERGIASVGVDAIVARSGVSKATLYRHFPSKEELVAAYLRRADEVWRRWLVEAMERRAANPREQLLAIFDWLKEWFARDDFRGCAFIKAAADLSDPAHPGHAVPLEHKQAVRRLILRLAKEAELRRPGELASEWMLLIDGAIAQALIEGDSSPASRAKRLAALALKARSE